MAAPPMRVYLRRDRLNAGANAVTQSRYFFIPVEMVDPVPAHEPVLPRLPGNDSRHVYGGNSTTNFGFNIGKTQLQINVSGVWQPMDAADYPTLPASASDFDVITNAQGDTVHGSSTTDGRPFPAGAIVYEHTGTTSPGTGTGVFTARQYRERMAEWIFDQALNGQASKWSNFRLGIKSWVTDDKWVEFKGFIAGQPKLGKEEAGYWEQFEYGFTFIVAATSEVLV